MKNIQRIASWGCRFSWLLVVLSVVMPLLVWSTAPYFFKQNHQPINEFIGYYEWLPAIPLALSMTTKLARFLIELIPNLLMVWCWLTSAAFFKAFRDGIIYSDENVKRLRRIGGLLVAAVLLQIPVQLGLSALLTLSAGTGHGEMVIHLDNADFACLMLSALVFLASWVLKEGVSLKDENDSIV